MWGQYLNRLPCIPDISKVRQHFVGRSRCHLFPYGEGREMASVRSGVINLYWGWFHWIFMWVQCHKQATWECESYHLWWFRVWLIIVLPSLSFFTTSKPILKPDVQSVESVLSIEIGAFTGGLTTFLHGAKVSRSADSTNMSGWTPVTMVNKYCYDDCDDDYYLYSYSCYCYWYWMQKPIFHCVQEFQNPEGCEVSSILMQNLLGKPMFPIFHS